VGSVVLHVTGCLYEDEDEFKDSEADIVSSGVLESARRMFASSLLDVLISSSTIHQKCHIKKRVPVTAQSSPIINTFFLFIFLWDPSSQ